MSMYSQSQEFVVNMARIEHNDTYVLLRVLQIMCAVIVTGQAVCILVPSKKDPDIRMENSFELLTIFTIVLGASSILKPFFWLFFQKLSDRFPKLVWVELIVDFQFGISWFLMFMIQVQAGHDSGPSGNTAIDAKKAAIAKLWTICQIFIIISGVLWQTSGIMNSCQIWKGRKRTPSRDRQALLEEHEFTTRSLRSKPSTSSTAGSSPIIHNDMIAEPGPSVIHWPMSGSYDFEARRLSGDARTHGRAL